MRRTRIAVAVSGLFAVMVVPASASALTIGSLASADPGAPCESISEAVFLAQHATASIPYTVPTGGGIVTSWSTSFGAAGSPATLLVLRPTGSPAVFSVVGADAETLPTPIPPSHVSNFTIASPIVAQAGDLLGLQLPAHSKVGCYYSGALGDELYLGLAGAISPGSLLTAVVPGTEKLTNVSATVVQSVDLGLSESIAQPSGQSGVALITLTASNTGPVAVPATIADTIPNGLHVVSASADNGNCAVAGQLVTCQLSSVPFTGEPPIANIVLAPSAPGSYSNQATIAPSLLPDENPANNTARATFTVSAPAVAPPPPCKTIQLAGASLAIAKLVIPALNCTVGKVTSKASKTVHKGLVISTSPGAGATLAAGSVVNIVTSSGPPKKKKKKKKKH